MVRTVDLMDLKPACISVSSVRSDSMSDHVGLAELEDCRKGIKEIN